MEECKPGISTFGIHAGLITRKKTPIFSARSCTTCSSRSLKQSALKNQDYPLKHTMRHRDLFTLFVLHEKAHYFFAGAKHRRLLTLVATKRIKITVIIGIRVVSLKSTEIAVDKIIFASIIIVVFINGIILVIECLVIRQA